jgi:hypothetical protein
MLTRLEDLKEGRGTQMPIYDFRKSQRVGYKFIPPPESRVSFGLSREREREREKEKKTIRI